MSNVPDVPEHDPRVAAAWREHSAEMPPVQLDTAILAAAHRAVGSAPRDAAGEPREATSPQRWWMPLAAAATIGAIALGILQTAPHDESGTAPSVSDMPAGQEKPAPPATRGKLAAPGAQRQSPPVPTESGTAVPPPTATAQVALPPTTKENPAAPVQDNLATMERKDSARAASAPAPAPAPTANGGVATAEDRVVAPPSAPMGAPSQPEAPQPFPADKKVEPAAMAPERARAAPAAAAAERDEARPRNEAARFAPSATGAPALGKTIARQDAATANPVDIDATLLRIRKLHDEGKLADAATELRALRAIVPDVDRRLPPELRAWAATVKP